MRFMLPRKARCRRTVDSKCFLRERLMMLMKDMLLACQQKGKTELKSMFTACTL